MRCGLQILRSCGLAVADFKNYTVADLRLRTFKNYEVADLRLRIQESRNIVADLRLRTKLLNVQLRTCGCGLRKLKFGCGFADCGLEKKLAVPSTVLKHSLEPAQLLLLSLFNRSWHSHTFPSCWKPTTIIPIHELGKPTSSPSFFRPISFTSCISKLFERLILSRLTFHLESNHLLSTCQAGFRPGRSPLDQILSQSIWDGFQKKKPPDRTILASVDFSKAFDLFWHSALFHKLLSLKLPPCFVLWVRSFLSDRRAKVQVGGSHSRSFRIRRGVPQGSVLGLVLFILFVDNITKDLLLGAHASLYADDLAIWSSSPRPAQSLLCCPILPRLETWSNLWRLPLNPKKCESSFFSTDPHQATFQPRLNLLGFPLLFNPTPKFLGVTFDRTLSFGAHVQSLWSKFYPRHKALRSIATASWCPTKESLSLLYKAFVRPVLTYACPGWFPFLCNTATNHLEVLHRAACRVITGCLFSTPSSRLLLEAQLPPLKLTLEHQTLYSFERAHRLPPDFSSLYAPKPSRLLQPLCPGNYKRFCRL